MIKYLVYGIGRSGQAAIELLQQHKLESVVVNKGELATWHDDKFGKNQYAESDAIKQQVFLQVKTIVLSPGIPRELPHLQEALDNGVEIISEIELAYRFLANKDIPIVAITGTNGKTTTTSLLGHLLKECGYNVFVGGNIGIPFCQLLLEKRNVDVIILELSSFQLESMDTFHPHISLLLNIVPNHGERYANVDDYARAKLHITDKMQAEDILLYFDQCGHYLDQYQPACQLFAFSEQTLPDSVFPELDISTFQLLGKHNQLNLYAALFAMSKLEFSYSFDQLSTALKSFKGVEYRLQQLESSLPYRVFNDAKSTNWDATLTALNAFAPDDEVAVIIGGQFRGHGDSITPYLSAFSDVIILLIGETTDQLAKELTGSGITFYALYNLPQVKRFLQQQNFRGTLVLSPAFPSFDQFKNYVERGRIFNELFTNKG